MMVTTTSILVQVRVRLGNLQYQNTKRNLSLLKSRAVGQVKARLERRSPCKKR